MIHLKEVWHSFGAQWRAWKGNQERQPIEVEADIGTDVDSHRKTEMRDHNSEDENTEKYYLNLCGWMEPKTHTSEPQESSSLWVLATQWYHWPVTEEKGSISNWLLFGYLQVLLSILMGNWHHWFVQYLYQSIKSNLKRNNCSVYCLLLLLVGILKLAKCQLLQL